MNSEIAAATPLEVCLPVSTASPTVSRRLAYLDNLKSFLTVLVVGHHAALAYVPFATGWTVQDTSTTSTLGPFIAVNAMFFMGLFFFTAGFFTAPAFDRKGALRFTADRALRLGIPALAWLTYNLVARARFEFWHMWFAWDLLALSILYALSRVVWRGSPAERQTPTFPRFTTILFFIALLAVGAAAARIWYPIGSWISVLGIFPLEPAHWVQYPALFVLGILAQRRSWLDALSQRQRQAWSVVATVAVALFVGHTWLGTGPEWFRTGGLYWQSLAYCTIEAVVCVSLCIALLWCFREFCTQECRLSRLLAKNAYGVYFIHFVPVLVLQTVLLPAGWPPLAKFLTVWTTGILASLLLSVVFLRSTAFARRVF